MTAENQALLQAIRAVVREEITPLSAKIDGLGERVDGLDRHFGRLEQRFDGLEQRFDGLEQRFDGLEQRFDGLSERVDRVETEQRLQRSLLHGIEESIDERFARLDLRLTTLEATTMRLQNEIGAIDTRTGQILSHVGELLELQDRVNEGFRSFKSDLQRAFIDIGSVHDRQEGYQRQMKQLRERVDGLERRLSKLEDLRGSRD